MDMEVGPEPWDEDVDLMPITSQATVQIPPPSVAEQAPSEEVEVVPLDDDLFMDVYNLSFDELQNKFVQARRNHFPDDHASLEFMRERVIMANTSRNPNSISNAS